MSARSDKKPTPGASLSDWFYAFKLLLKIINLRLKVFVLSVRHRNLLRKQRDFLFQLNQRQHQPTPGASLSDLPVPVLAEPLSSESAQTTMRASESGEARESIPESTVLRAEKDRKRQEGDNSRGGQNLPKVVCAWCATILKEGDPTRISHGVCEPCKEGLLAAAAFAPLPLTKMSCPDSRFFPVV
jgi:hypothetical protein